MPSYTAPVEDMQFILHDVLETSALDIPGYAALDPEFTGAVLDAAGKIASEILAPLNIIGDTHGCVLENGVVRTPPGFRAAFDTVREGGWTALDLPEKYGGQGMPFVMYTACSEISSAANQAFTMYQGLTHGAASTILAHGTEAQKDRYLPRMTTCEWTGTMNLTEPHCGTDLGLLRTRAEPQDDGSYKITGQKIFISSGEHDMADNIIHLVLARIPGGPDGIKGVSLFIVPKIRVDAHGRAGARNAVSCGKLEAKMGIHGNATCVMDYDGATGELLGAPHRGMRAIFTMMNEARIGVGMQGVGQAEVAYQNARDHARDRRQGRAATGAAQPEAPADPLIVHPDIRRALLDQKSFAEGGRALLLWGSLLIDKAQRGDDAAARGLIGLLTPVIKGFLTDEAFDMTIRAQQVFGGQGYIESSGMSQFARDARVAMIYEGANGVQARDLVGRKLPGQDGDHLAAFLDEVTGFITDYRDVEALKAGFLDPLDAATKDLRQAALFLARTGLEHPDDALSGSYDFMHLTGHVCLGFMWARMAKAAYAALETGPGDPEFYHAKIRTGRFYMTRRLPATALHLARLQSGAAPVMDMGAEQF